MNGTRRCSNTKRAPDHQRRVTSNDRYGDRVKGTSLPSSITMHSRPPGVCWICGASIKPGFKYCRGCVPTISKENVLEAAKLGRLATHKPQAQARRSETQRRQNAARKAWNPAEKPNWLDEQAYREKIIPRLSGVGVPTIMRAVAVSEPYALRIRGGRCVPHPRHWPTLAGLVGVSSGK